MTKFFADEKGETVPLEAPEDVRRFLAEPDKHWRDGFSAAELARAWLGAQDIPAAVREVLETWPDAKDAELSEGWFEHKTRLRSKGRESQTDLLAIVETRQGEAVLAVEGKRDETFGPIVREWNDGPGKAARLRDLCDLLGLDPADCGELRYQLFHRSAAAILETQRRGLSTAILLVHSFSERQASHADYAAFLSRLGISDATPGRVTPAVERNGVWLRFAWVSDPRPL